MNKTVPSTVYLDATLLETVRCALTRSRNSWLKRIEVSIVDDVVILKGSVPTFHLKQLALAAVQRVPGVLLVDNQLKVGAPID